MSKLGQRVFYFNNLESESGLLQSKLGVISALWIIVVLSFLSALAVKKQLYKHLVFCPFHSLIDNDNDDGSNDPDSGNNVQ